MMIPTASLLLLCAGSGSRMQGQVEDKILQPLAGKPVFLHSFEAFCISKTVGSAVLIVRDRLQESAMRGLLATELDYPLPLRFVCGGIERQDSVLNGLEALTDKDGEFVFIHDAARPLVRPEQLHRLLRTAFEDGDATLARPVVDTIKQRPVNFDTTRQTRWETLDRRRLWTVETPQVFRRQSILNAYRNAQGQGLRLTDDTAALEAIGAAVSLIENPFPNPKLTHPSDWEYLEHLLRDTKSG